MYRFLLSLAVTIWSGTVLAQGIAALPSRMTYGELPGDRSTQVISTLTLEMAIEMAMTTNPELAASGWEVEAAQAAVMQANTWLNPSIDLLMEDTRSATREATVQVTQPIELGGKRAARVHVAELGSTVAGVEFEAKRADIRATTVAAFFDVLAATERVRLAEQTLGLAQRSTLIASRRVVAGKISPVEETKARVAEATVRLEHAQARSELASAVKRLRSMWGRVAPQFDHVDGRLDLLPELPDANTIQSRIEQAPALARARHEVDRRHASTQLERSRQIPDLNLTLGVKRSEEQGRNLAIVGVSIPLPLFDTNRGNVLESLRRVDQARDELSATAIRIESEVAQASEALYLSRLEAESLRDDIIPAAQSAYDAATKGFEHGKFGFLDVLDAQRTLLQAKSQYLKTLAAAHRSSADINRILGDRFLGDRTSGDRPLGDRANQHPTRGNHPYADRPEDNGADVDVPPSTDNQSNKP